MKNYLTNQIRNVAILGSSGSGKTTISEAILFEGKVIARRGDVESKNTASDYNLVEQVNSRSIYSSVLYAEVNDCKINFIDCPGFDDFVGGVVSALHVTDAIVMLINAQNGVEVGTEIQCRYADKAGKPMIFVMNQLDHEKANFERSFEMLKERFGGNVVLVQYPVNSGSGFNQVVDLIGMKLLTFDDNGKVDKSDIPDSEKEKAEELRAILIEKAAESDEKLMEKFFETETLSEEEMLAGIKTGVKTCGMFPVLCVSAKKDFGVYSMLDFIANVSPAPNEMPAPKNTNDEEIKCDASGHPSLFVFKTSIEQHVGEISYFKVMSGEIAEAIDLTNNNTQTKERLAQLFVAAGKNRVKVSKLTAGDIGTTLKLKNTKTNNTLTAAKSYTFPNIDFPEPKYRIAIKTQNEGDEEKLGDALGKLHDEDPTLMIEYSKELKQIILSGQGELHLNILKWFMDNVFKIQVEFLAPKIPYRETITKIAQADYRHKKQSGGAGQFGEVHLVIEPHVEGAPNPTMYKVAGKDIKINVRGKEEYPLSWGGMLVYFNCIVGGSIDARFMPAILKGIMEKMEEGPLTGCYARDIRISVYDGKMHPVDSNEISFRLAGRNAFREAFKNAGPKILEPVYDVEILVPADRMGDVISDLQGRRGIVQGMSSEKGFEKIKARVPLAEMNKYSVSLSSLTGGRAMYSMKFAEYVLVPAEVQDQLIKAYEAEQNEE